MPLDKNNVGLTLEMKYLKIIVCILCSVTATTVFAQPGPPPSDTVRSKVQQPLRQREFKAQRAVVFRFNYSYCFPQADLGKRFGVFSNLGGSVGMKFESGWDLRAEGGFIFGRNVLEYSMLDSLRNSDGYLVDKDGFNFNPQLSMRGFNVSAHLGRLFPLDRNRNSGLFVSLGGGFLQHRMHFQSVSNFAPQLQGDYMKGYDRLTNGYYVQEFIGYQYMSSKKMVNFYVGLEFTQGRTQFARNWNYDLMGPDTKTRSDNYWGVRIGWILPIYGANRDEDEFIFR